MADNVSLIGMDERRRVPLSPAESMRLEQVSNSQWIMRRFISNPTSSPIEVSCVGGLQRTVNLLGCNNMLKG